jgi:hypothetical protein
MSLVAELIAAVEGSSFASFVSLTPFAYAVLSAAHIIGIALLVGSIVPVDLRLLGVLGPQFDAALASLVRIAVLGFATAASSGAALASVRLGEYASNPAFLGKMALLAAAGLNAAVLRIACGSLEGLWAHSPAGARRSGALSLLFWTAAIFAGRLIAFT